MKGLIIGGAVVLGFVLGMWPHGLMQPKPVWWRWLTALAMILTVVMAFGIPTGGDFYSAEKTVQGRTSNAMPVPVYGIIVSVQTAAPGNPPSGGPASQTVGALTLQDEFGVRRQIFDSAGVIAQEGLRTGDMVILDVHVNRQPPQYVAVRHVATNPLLTLPLIPELDERARNLYFHVPCAWLAQVAWFVAFGYAIVSLRKRRPEDDIRATAAAGLGALFCILATISGSVWARFNWNAFWSWDPRQIAIFVVLVIFGAYFALRSAVPNEEQRSRLSAVYLILMLLPVIFFMFVFPRITEGLHPGSADSPNAGPLLSPARDSLNPTKQVVFALSFFSFTMLFFWMLNLSVRMQLAALRQRRALVGREMPAQDAPITTIGSLP